MNVAPYVFFRFNAWLEVDLTTTPAQGSNEKPKTNTFVVPISNLQLDYELNAIPQATVTIPMGRNAYTGEPSPVHSQLLSLVEPTPVRIVVQVDAAAGVYSDLGIPDGAFVVFAGRTAAIGINKSTAEQTASFSLMIRHWLADLDYSSIFTKYGHPSNPAAFNAAASLPAGTAGTAIYRGPFDTKNALTDENIAKDLWNEAIKPFLLGLAATDSLAVLDQDLQPTLLPNNVATEALKRIYSYPSLELDMTNLDGNTASMIGLGLESYVGRDMSNRFETEEGLAGSTFWGLTAGALGPDYLFAIVPRVNDALVVPFVPGLKKPYKTLLADQVFGMAVGGELPRPIRAFGVMNSFQSRTDKPATDQSTKSYMVGGWFQAKGRTEGMIRIEPAPRWAADALGLTTYTNASVGAFEKTIATADQPAAAGEPKKEETEKAAKTKAAKRTFLNRYAKARMVHEHGVNRQADVTGPLRFDVAPGSAVALQSVSDANLGFDQTNTTFHGTVLRVSTVLDINSKQAYTTFHLSHIRTSTQNNTADSGYSIVSHPLYAETYSGAPLYEATVEESSTDTNPNPNPSPDASPTFGLG